MAGGKKARNKASTKAKGERAAEHWIVPSGGVIDVRASPSETVPTVDEPMSYNFNPAIAWDEETKSASLTMQPMRRLTNYHAKTRFDHLHSHSSGWYSFPSPLAFIPDRRPRERVCSLVNEPINLDFMQMPGEAYSATPLFTQLKAYGEGLARINLQVDTLIQLENVLTAGEERPRLELKDEQSGLVSDSQWEDFVRETKKMDLATIQTRLDTAIPAATYDLARHILNELHDRDERITAWSASRSWGLPDQVLHTLGTVLPWDWHEYARATTHEARYRKLEWDTFNAVHSRELLRMATDCYRAWGAEQQGFKLNFDFDAALETTRRQCDEMKEEVESVRGARVYYHDQHPDLAACVSAMSFDELDEDCGLFMEIYNATQSPETSAMLQKCLSTAGDVIDPAALIREYERKRLDMVASWFDPKDIGGSQLSQQIRTARKDRTWHTVQRLARIAEEECRRRDVKSSAFAFGNLSSAEIRLIWQEIAKQLVRASNPADTQIDTGDESKWKDVERSIRPLRKRTGDKTSRTRSAWTDADWARFRRLLKAGGTRGNGASQRQVLTSNPQTWGEDLTARREAADIPDKGAAPEPPVTKLDALLSCINGSWGLPARPKSRLDLSILPTIGPQRQDCRQDCSDATRKTETGADAKMSATSRRYYRSLTDCVVASKPGPTPEHQRAIAGKKAVRGLINKSTNRDRWERFSRIGAAWECPEFYRREGVEDEDDVEVSDAWVERHLEDGEDAGVPDDISDGGTCVSRDESCDMGYLSKDEPTVDDLSDLAQRLYAMLQPQVEQHQARQDALQGVEDAEEVIRQMIRSSLASRDDAGDVDDDALSTSETAVWSSRAITRVGTFSNADMGKGAVNHSSRSPLRRSISFQDL